MVAIPRVRHSSWNTISPPRAALAKPPAMPRARRRSSRADRGARRTLEGRREARIVPPGNVGHVTCEDERNGHRDATIMRCAGLSIPDRSMAADAGERR